MTPPPSNKSPSKPFNNYIDLAQLRALLAAFFLMNFRGSLTQHRGRGGKGMGMWWIVAYYALFGGLVGLAVNVIETPMFYFLLLHGITFTLIGMVVLVESGQIMFNPNEEDVLGHMPVSQRTIVAAKLLNLTGFALMLAAAFNVGPMFMALKLHGMQPWTPLAHLLTLVPLCLFCSGSVVLIYGLISRFAGRERFETVISWAQVAMSVFFVIGYQLLGPVIGKMHTSVDVHSVPFLWALPPRWFAALDTALSLKGAEDAEWLGGGFALAATFIVALLGISRLAAGRERQAVVAALPEKIERKPAVIAKPQRPLAPWLRWWLRDPAEAGAFRLTAAYMRRDKDVRHRLYPSLAMVVVFPFFFLFNRTQGAGSMMYLYMCFWMLATLPLSAIETMRLSQDWQASDLFYYSPLEGSGALFQGVRKAALYYAALPCAVLLVALLSFTAPDPAGMLRTAVPLVILIPTISLLSGLGGNYLPLSRPPKAGEQSRSSQGPFLAMMLVLPLIMGIIFLVQKAVGYIPQLAIELAVLAVGHRALMRLTKRRHEISMQ